MPDKGITYRTYQGINQVPKEAWDHLAIKSSLIYTSDYWRLIEDSDIGCFCDFHYIIVSDYGCPVCIASCYCFEVDVRTDLNQVFGKAIDVVRKIFPEFLRVKLLECGTPINTQTPPFLASVDRNEQAVLACLGKALQEIARNNQVRFLRIKDITEPLLEKYSQNNMFRGWSFIESVPGTHVDIKWRSIDEYLGSMKSYYRSKLNKHLGINAQRHITCKRVVDFSGLAEKLSKQWLTVHKNANSSKREIINENFYTEICHKFGSKSMVLLFHAEEELVGHALLILDRNILRWLYIGREKSANDSLYQIIMYKVIETGIALRVDKIDCGPTTYSVKRDLGAQIDPLYYALKCNLAVPYKFMDFIVRRILRNKTPMNKEVFKD